MTDDLAQCKSVIAATIDRLVAEGVRKANIEIDLIHFIKAKLYRGDDYGG
jgi:hypothetical protein